MVELKETGELSISTLTQQLHNKSRAGEFNKIILRDVDGVIV